MSAPVDADLLRADSWTISNRLRCKEACPGKSWSEGNIVTTPEDKLVNILRIRHDGGEKAAIIDISRSGKRVKFDRENGLIDFPGGGAKFTIRYDPVTKRYWSLVNKQSNPKAYRNILVLTSSKALRNWKVESIILRHQDSKNVAWQYIDWLIEGEDIIAVSRTAFNGAHNAHNANYFTFHRIRNFRELTLEDLSEISSKEQLIPIASGLQKELEKDLASFGVQANWPFAVKTMGEKARVYINRGAEFSQIPEFLQGLQYTLHHRNRIINFSCHVKSSGRIYLYLFGDKTPKSIGQHRDWKKCGTIRGPSFRGKNRWTIYQANVHAGEILTLSRDDKMGITVIAKEITEDKIRPLPKMPTIANAQKYIAGKSVEDRPIEYLVFGDGNDVVFIMATIHGHEQMGIALAQRLAIYLQEHPYLLEGHKVILMPIANPDGVVHYSKNNANNVNLNRNFEAANRRNGKMNGPHALSEPEARVIKQIIQKYSPNRIVSIHQFSGWTIDGKRPPGMIDHDGPAEGIARHMTKYCKLPAKRWGTEPGSLGAYAGETLGIPIITLELPKYDVELSPEQLWEKYGNALIAAVVYPEKAK